MDFAYIGEIAWPVLWPMFIGGLPCFVIVWILFFFPIRILVRRYHERRVKKHAAAKKMKFTGHVSMMSNKLRLGVNIDHVATIRNARGGSFPDPVRAALLAADAGADGITAHLREDRRHISDEDITRLINELHLPLNFEMAATEEMVDIALRHRPHAACIVPEKREERTTEGGLDAKVALTNLSQLSAD